MRRALGASRRTIAMQSLVETGLVGVVGAAAGLAVTVLGVSVMRAILSDEYGALAYLDAKVVVIEVLLAVAATIAAGLYPPGARRGWNRRCSSRPSDVRTRRQTRPGDLPEEISAPS